MKLTISPKIPNFVIMFFLFVILVPLAAADKSTHKKVTVDMGNIVFKLPEKCRIRQPYPSFFAFYAVWTPWSGLTKTLETQTINKRSSKYFDYDIEVLVSGNVVGGETYKEWLIRHNEELKKRRPSPYKGLDQFNSGNVWTYISKQKIFGLQKNEPLVFVCGPGICHIRDMQSWKCTTGVRINNTTYVKYRFCNTQLTNWPDLHFGIIHFLKKNSRSK